MTTLWQYQPQQTVGKKVYASGPLDPRLVTDSLKSNNREVAWSQQFQKDILVVKDEDDFGLLLRLLEHAAAPKDSQKPLHFTQEERESSLIRDLFKKDVIKEDKPLINDPSNPPPDPTPISAVLSAGFQKIFQDGCYIHYTPKSESSEKSIAVVIDPDRNVFYADPQAAPCPASLQTKLKQISTKLNDALHPPTDEDAQRNEAIVKEVISEKPSSCQEGDDIGFTIQYFLKLEQELEKAKKNPPAHNHLDEEQAKKEREKYLNRVAQNVSAIITPTDRKEIAKAVRKEFKEETYQTAIHQKWRKREQRIEDAYRTYLKEAKNLKLTCNFSNYQILPQEEQNQLKWQATNIFSSEKEGDAIHIEGTTKINSTTCSYTTKITGSKRAIEKITEEKGPFLAFMTAHVEALLNQYFINRFPNQALDPNNHNPPGKPPENLPDDQKVIRVNSITLSDKEGATISLSKTEEERLKKQFEEACKKYFAKNGYKGFTLTYDPPKKKKDPTNSNQGIAVKPVAPNP